jgi:N utilization substance protein B
MNKCIKKSNVRHNSIRKKTGSRICSTQVLYGLVFENNDINFIINTFLDNYLFFILKKLNIKEIDIDLFKSIIFGVLKNKDEIDNLISDHLSTNWSFDRLSLTEKIILRSATYELVFENNFKKVTIINEYVSIMTA